VLIAVPLSGLRVGFVVIEVFTWGLLTQKLTLSFELAFPVSAVSFDELLDVVVCGSLWGLNLDRWHGPPQFSGGG
jgi:hypothetical protein